MALRWRSKDVVVVTINYRLGLFGFFAHPELAAESGASRRRRLWLARPDGGAQMGA